MTRAEAAKICQSIKFILENSDYTEAVEEALNMAIEALEQEPTAEYSSEVISRQAVLNLAKEGKLLSGNIYKKASDYINELPSADRPTGHWIYHPEWEYDGGCGYECSVCNMGSDVDYNFCMRCGAEMRGKQNE